MRFFAPALIFCGVLASTAQSPLVPHKIHFAGMTLTVRDEARELIQKDVNLLTQSPKYFNIKAERARTYFPIIERIFEEERVPTDFKYLVLQESALIADAVSVSDAVGFWQFKDFTAREMGLRVDDDVDERMNIVSSTRAAARYIKQNNYMFNNWIYALQAYQMGAGGVKRLVGDDLDGSRHMDITAETYWYVMKYLAHKVAFEDAVKGSPQLKVAEHPLTAGGSISQMASSLDIETSRLAEFNKWVRKGEVPADRSYTLIVPTGSTEPDFSKLLVGTPPAQQKPSPVGKVEEEILINEIPVLQARQGENLGTLAERAGLSLSHFLKYNELPSDHVVRAGGFYFKDKKRSKTEDDFHKVLKGEDLWTISQQHGIHVRRLRKLNRLGEGQEPTVGSMVWLNVSKPREQTDDEHVLELEEEFIEWDHSRATNRTSTERAPSPPQDEAGYHTVLQGETLYAIARSYQLSVADLRTLNGLSGSMDIHPGQKLLVSEEMESLGDVPPENSQGVVHEVRPSDTMYSVARKYGITVKELMDRNQKEDFTLAPGEKLLIPSKRDLR